jgi:hypothetical protein
MGPVADSRASSRESYGYDTGLSEELPPKVRSKGADNLLI